MWYYNNQKCLPVESCFFAPQVLSDGMNVWDSEIYKDTKMSGPISR